MRLAYTAEDEGFRTQVRGFLTERIEQARALPSDPVAAVAHSRAWQLELHRAGYVGMAWPRAYGGQDASPTRQVIFGEECARIGAPPLINTIGLTILGPALIAYGSEDQKRHYLPRILRADDLWCQGFSEPGAGSDLASLRTTALLDGDEFVVNGQKVWTSLGPTADWCFLLARTRSAGRPQEGISYLLMNMRSRGVRVAPLRQLTGKSHFSEIFLDDVRIPRANLVGELHQGWRVVKATLSFERSGLAGVVDLEKHLAKLTELARSRGLLVDHLQRQRLAQLWIAKEALKYTGYRVLTAQARGVAPGPESAVGKLVASELRRDIMDTALELQGPYAAIGRGNPQALDRGRWQGLYLDARAYTIGGGTSEILRNVIAERALGLPRSTEGA